MATKLDLTGVPEERDSMVTKHAEAEGDIAEIAEIKRRVGSIFRRCESRLHSEDKLSIERSLEPEDTRIREVAAKLAEKIKVIDFLTSLEESKGSMDSLMEGPDYADPKKLFARAFAMLEKRISELLTSGTDADRRKFCCLGDSNPIVSPRLIAFEAIKNSSTPDRLTPQMWEEITTHLTGYGMPFDSKRNPEERKLAEDYIRRRIEMIMDIVMFKRWTEEGSIGGDGADVISLYALISKAFDLDKEVVKEVLNRIMARTCKKRLAEEAK